jgi:hypothetical protein
MTDFHKSKHRVANIGIGENSYKISMSLDGRWFCTCGGSTCDHVRSYKQHIGYEDNILEAVKALINTNNNQTLIQEWIRIQPRAVLLLGLSDQIDKFILTLQKKVGILLRHG